jgi:hypothetical protein
MTKETKKDKQLTPRGSSESSFRSIMKRPIVVLGFANLICVFLSAAAEDENELQLLSGVRGISGLCLSQAGNGS